MESCPGRAKREKEDGWGREPEGSNTSFEGERIGFLVLAGHYNSL